VSTVFDDRVGALLLRRPPIGPGKAAPVGQDDCGADLGAAEVDSDDGTGGQDGTSRSNWRC